MKQQKQLTLEQQYREVFKGFVPDPMQDSDGLNLEQPYFGRIVDSRTSDSAYEIPATSE